MNWTPEKLCAEAGHYDLLVERHKNGYHCRQNNGSWRWAIVHNGVVMSQGTAHELETAQKMAESNLPL
jgi:hypothetical protein